MNNNNWVYIIRVRVVKWEREWEKNFHEWNWMIWSSQFVFVGERMMEVFSQVILIAHTAHSTVKYGLIFSIVCKTANDIKSIAQRENRQFIVQFKYFFVNMPVHGAYILGTTNCKLLILLWWRSSKCNLRIFINIIYLCVLVSRDFTGGK